MNKQQAALQLVYDLDDVEWWKDEVNRLIGPVAQMMLALEKRGYDPIYRQESFGDVTLCFRVREHRGRNVFMDIKHVGDAIGYLCTDVEKEDESPRGSDYVDCSVYRVKYRKSK